MLQLTAEGTGAVEFHVSGVALQEEATALQNSVAGSVRRMRTSTVVGNARTLFGVSVEVPTMKLSGLAALWKAESGFWITAVGVSVSNRIVQVGPEFCTLRETSRPRALI